MLFFEKKIRKNVKTAIFSLIFYFCGVPSNAVEKTTGEGTDRDIQSIIERKYPHLSKKHWNICRDLREKSQKKHICLYGEHLTVYEREARLYACEEEHIFTILADYLFDTGLKFLRWWLKGPVKFHKMQRLGRAFMEGEWSIEPSEVYKNTLVFSRAGENDPKERYRISVGRFALNIFFYPSLYYYSKAHQYATHNRNDLREQTDLVQVLKKRSP